MYLLIHGETTNNLFMYYMKKFDNDTSYIHSKQKYAGGVTPIPSKWWKANISFAIWLDCFFDNKKEAVIIKEGIPNKIKRYLVKQLCSYGIKVKFVPTIKTYQLKYV